MDLLFVKNVDRATVIVLAYVNDLVFLESTSAVLKTIICGFFHCFEGFAEPLEWYLRVNIIATPILYKFLRMAKFNTGFQNLDQLTQNPTPLLWPQTFASKQFFTQQQLL